ncbi:MAG: hypothetical protein EXR99_04465 [Gemmataceae bacterium]|nr:hypothetical protein [Gemmataceae bacterium]
MHFLDPEIFADVNKLSALTLIFLAAFSLLLWTMGYTTHKFWVVFLSTGLAGYFGFETGPAMGMQPLLSALLFGFSAGILSLALIRVFVFLLGGMTGASLAGVFLPAGDPWVAALLVGGLLAILLYPFWFTGFSSLLGTIGFTYGILALLDRLNAVDGAGLLDKKPGLVDAVAMCMVVIGAIIQYYIHRWYRKNRWRQCQDEERDRLQREAVEYSSPSLGSWWKNPWRHAG